MIWVAQVLGPEAGDLMGKALTAAVVGQLVIMLFAALKTLPQLRKSVDETFPAQIEKLSESFEKGLAEVKRDIASLESKVERDIDNLASEVKLVARDVAVRNGKDPDYERRLSRVESRVDGLADRNRANPPQTAGA